MIFGVFVLRIGLVCFVRSSIRKYFYNLNGSIVGWRFFLRFLGVEIVFGFRVYLESDIRRILVFSKENGIVIDSFLF